MKMKKLVAMAYVIVVLGSVIGTARPAFADRRISTVPINQITSVSSEDSSADRECLTVSGFLPDFVDMRDMKVAWIQGRRGPVVVQFSTGDIVRTFGMTDGQISVRIRVLVDGNKVPIGQLFGGSDNLEFFIQQGVQSLPPVSFTWVTSVAMSASELHQVTVQWTVTDVSPGGSFDQDVCVGTRSLNIYHR